MIGTMVRSLHIRDDGTGRGREINGTFSEFESEDAIILLGDPGMGKTTLFRAAAKENYTTVRNFLVDPHIAVDKPLFLDAFDEYRSIASGQDASSEIAKTLCSLNKPKFRLSCRAADWFGSTDQEVLRVASASGRVVVLELCPMSRDEIPNAVQGIVQNPDVFLNEADSAGLGKLLGNPQTLNLLARAWETDKKPQNKFEAYEIGVSELIREINPEHAARGANRSDPGDLRKAASAAASTLLLSNSVGISRTETAVGNGYVGLPVVPHPNRSDLDAVLKRRLFISPKADLFEPAHRTLVEFLAAEDLSNRIANGLPIDRVLALICGVGGGPISSLRGLFAWLMCKLGHVAESYVERDPYGVVTYGDASVLPPKAQYAIWAGLRQLRDPWFLTREEDHGSFNELANANTARTLEEILKDPVTGIHLKIAVLEAIANSTENIGLIAILRDMVLAKHNNTWLRSNALKALYKSIQNDPVELDDLDRELAQAVDDIAAPEIRVDLLRLTHGSGKLARRILSILEQASAAEQEDHNIGRFYSLIDLPPDSDLDEILESPSLALTPKRGHRFEIQSLFEHWLQRRLDSSAPITPLQLSGWLRKMRVSREYYSEETLTSLKARFEQDATLFERVFELLGHPPPNDERSFWLFVAHDLWKMLPVKVWLVPQSGFFLSRAQKECNPERATDFFRMYLSWFPVEGASVAQAEAGFDFLAQRHDVAEVLGNWNNCEIEKWRRDDLESREEERRRHSENRAQRVADFSPRLTSIREGKEEHILAWAAMVYQGLFYDLADIPDADNRLVSVTNEEVADALVQGFMHYVENPNIPKKKAIIESWLENKIPRTHILLTLSVFLRQKTGMIVPVEALPNCLAAVVTAFPVGNKVPGYHETLSAWIFSEVRQNPNVVKSILKEMWILGATNKNADLPGFSQISRDCGSQKFLASLSANVLETGINEAHETVGKLVSILLFHDQQAAIVIGKTELARSELSSKVLAIWSTALFVIDPTKHLNSWRTLMSGEDAALWNAIEIIRGVRYETRAAVSLASVQRAEIVAVMGQRFPHIGRPFQGWDGNQEPWDASEFIANQIRLLAADYSTDAGNQLERLENDGGLASYHDLIRHHRAQHQKQQRESSFEFASPEEVAEAISNRAPATPRDLLAFIIDHFGELSRGITRTQRERYRAYWNESGKKLIKPKHEEVCSGLLAEDLQNRIQTHNLIVTVEHHMVADKECDLVVLQGIDRLLPIEVKHHFNRELWTAWRTQLDRLYTSDAMASGHGIYLVLWSGEDKNRKMPKIPNGIKRPASATGLCRALESLIPEEDRHRLRVVVVDISRH
ncbi:MAG: hypothetical protein GY846_23635 [Deltaproteobacteria bacterium]|nr:hypothetical protein [Deltaproteobacteria bacterium]